MASGVVVDGRDIAIAVRSIEVWRLEGVRPHHHLAAAHRFRRCLEGAKNAAAEPTTPVVFPYPKQRDLARAAVGPAVHARDQVTSFIVKEARKLFVLCDARNLTVVREQRIEQPAPSCAIWRSRPNLEIVHVTWRISRGR